MEPAAYAEAEFAQDALDVMDATATERAVIVGLSRGAQRALLLATKHPDRITSAVFVAPYNAKFGRAGVAPAHERMMILPRRSLNFEMSVDAE